MTPVQFPCRSKLLPRLLTAVAMMLGAVAPVLSAPLTVYAAMGYDQSVVTAFTKATGIPVNLVHLSTGPLLARVQAESSHPQWDVVWFDGNLGMRALAAQRRLDCGWMPSAHYTRVGQAQIPGDRCYWPVGITYANALLVNTARMAAKAQPHTWNELAQPALRGRVGMNNPAISGPAFPLVAGVLQSMGEAAGKAYFAQLKSAGLRIYPTNSVTLRALQFGQIDVAVVQSSAAIGFAQGKPQLQVVIPQPATALPSDLAIGSKVQGATLQQARQFVEFVLSSAGQSALQKGDVVADSNFVPIIDGVQPLPVVSALQPGRILALDPATWGRREAEIDTWFTEHVVR